MSKDTNEPRSYRAALSAAKENPALFSGVDLGDRTDFFNRSIILQRLFANSPEKWVLKGASALLWRDMSARRTQDLDLFRIGENDLREAYNDLAQALAQRTTAPFDVDFHLSSFPEHIRDEGPRSTTAIRIEIKDLQGKRIGNPVKVDLVTGSVMTATPEKVPTLDLAQALRSEPQQIQLYPLVDHVADKVAATMQTYGAQNSTRVRDLIDLAHLASTGTFSLSELARAIDSERRQRGLEPYSGQFNPPPAWAGLYPGYQAKQAPGAPRAYEEALEQVRSFVEPAMNGPVEQENIWDQGRWTPIDANSHGYTSTEFPGFRGVI